MAVEFMTGATVFALINLFVFLVVVYLFVRGLKKVYVQWKDHESVKDVKVPPEFFYMMIVGLLVVFFGSATQPKLSIDPVQNRELIEYQDNSEEVVIETPPPRTEKMDGFTPLKE